MKEFLMLLGWLSLTGSLLGLAVWAAGKYGGTKLGHAFFSWLWVLVLLRLAVPFGVPQSLRAQAPFLRVNAQVQQAQAAAKAEAEAAVQQRLDAIPGASLLSVPVPDASAVFEKGSEKVKTDHPEKPMPQKEDPAQTSGVAQAVPDTSISILLEEKQAVREGAALQRAVRIVFWLWAAGAGFFALRLGIGYARFRRCVLRTGCDATAAAHAAFGCEYAGGRLQLVSSPAVSCAMVIGLLRPVVVLPQGAAMQDPARLAAVLRHELTHYRRGDLWLKWAAALIACLHWFNPLVWMFQKQIGRVCELACDERVIRTMTAAEKQHYGETLLAFAARRKGAAVPLTAICEHKQQLKERLVNIMKYKKKGFWTLLLCAVLALALIGCAAVLGPAESESTPAPQSGASVSRTGEAAVEAAIATVDDSTVQTVTTVTVAKELKEHIDVAGTGMTAANGRLWVYGSKTLDDGTYQKKLISFLPDGSDWQVTEVDYPPTEPELEAMVTENRRFYKAALALVGAGGEAPYLYWNLGIIENPGADGVLVASEDRLSAFGGETGIGTGVRLDGGEYDGMSYAFKCAGDGTLWVEAMTDAFDFLSQCYLLGFSAESGELTAALALPPETMINSMQPLQGGRLVLHTEKVVRDGGGYRSEENSDVFYILDSTAETLTLNDPLALPEELMQGVSVTLLKTMDSAPLAQPVLCVSKTDGGLYRWDVENNILYKMADWAMLGNSFDGYSATVLPDGTVYAVNHGMDPTPNSVRIITPADNTAAADGCAVITVGGVQVSDAFLSTVEEFNLAHPDMRVELVDYSDAAAEKEGFESGLDMLHRHLIQGGGPDVVLVSTSAGSSLYRKGVLLDLYPYMDADPDIAREDFFASVLKACEQDGKLLAVAPSFGIETVVGSAERFGDTVGWTEAEFAAATAGCATPFYGWGRQTMLWHRFNAAGKSFIDYAVGTARIDTPEFIRLLESTAAYPVRTDLAADPSELVDPKEIFAQEKSLLYVASYFSLGDFPTVTYYFDGPVTFVGFPNEEGRSGSVFLAQWQVGIRSTCADPDAAWRFVRELLLPGYQQAVTEEPHLQFELPLRRDTMNKLIEKMSKDNRAPFSSPPALPHPLTAEQQKYFSRGITRQESDSLLALIEATDAFFRYDDTVLSVLSEEAEYYYSGTRSAADTAAIIQNRIQTYLDEQG